MVVDAWVWMIETQNTSVCCDCFNTIALGNFLKNWPGGTAQVGFDSATKKRCRRYSGLCCSGKEYWQRDAKRLTWGMQEVRKWFMRVIVIKCVPSCGIASCRWLHSTQEPEKIQCVPLEPPMGINPPTTCVNTPFLLCAMMSLRHKYVRRIHY